MSKSDDFNREFIDTNELIITPAWFNAFDLDSWYLPVTRIVHGHVTLLS